MNKCWAVCNLRNSFKGTRRHCRCHCRLLLTSHKGFYSVRDVTFSRDDGGGKEINKKKSEWLYGLLNPKSNIIVRAPLLSSSHQILPLALIENPRGPSWKRRGALEKRCKKMPPSFLSKCLRSAASRLPAQLFQLERLHRQFHFYLKWLWPGRSQ